MNYHKCPISRSSLPPQHLENQVQFRQRADFFSPPWPPALEVVWQAQMPPLPPSPTSPETTRSFSDGCFCELIFAKDFPFLKLWKSPSTSYTAPDFSFFNKYFYNPYHPNSSPSKHLSFIPSTLTFSALSQPSLQMGFHPQNGLSAHHLLLPRCPDLLPRPSGHLSLCSLLSASPFSHMHIRFLHFYSTSIPCSLLHCLTYLQVIFPQHQNPVFPSGASCHSRSLLITCVSGRYIEIWT